MENLLTLFVLIAGTVALAALGNHLCGMTGLLIGAALGVITLLGHRF